MLLSHFLASPADRPPLRIGLVLEGTSLPRHALEIVQHIKASDFARAEVVVFCGASGATGHQGWLFDLYRRWDERHVSARVDPLAPVDGSGALSGLPTLAANWGPPGGPPAEAVQQLRDVRLDVLLDLRSGGRAGDLPFAARYGVWRLRHGIEPQDRGGPGGFWEVCEANPLSGAALEAHGAEGSVSPIRLCDCVVATTQGLSWARNRLAPYWAANTFVIQKLRELHASGWPELTRRVAAVRPLATSRRERGTPTNWDMLRWLVPTVVGKAARRAVRPSVQPEWRVAVRRSDRPLLDRGAADRAKGFRWVDAPPGHALADPFLVEQAGRTWAFLEDIDVASGRGRIAVAELTPDGELGELVRVMERASHLSYPCVFSDHGEMFMVPESSASGTVELHRCVRFPQEWTFECVLLNVAAVDTTVWIEAGRYWLFTTLLEPRSHTGQLWLFSAEALTGPWAPHPANPISTDVRNNRGAGAMFRHGGRLYRPSQDCSGRYGRTFSLNEVETLTLDRYSERAGVTVEPEPGFVGTHTYARSGSVEMVDGCFVRRA